MQIQPMCSDNRPCAAGAAPLTEAAGQLHLGLGLGWALGGAMVCFSLPALAQSTPVVDTLQQNLITSIQDLFRLPLPGLDQSITALFYSIAYALFWVLWLLALSYNALVAYVEGRFIGLILYICGSSCAIATIAGGGYAQLSEILDNLAQGAISTAWAMAVDAVLGSVTDAVLYLVIWGLSLALFPPAAMLLVSRVPGVGESLAMAVASSLDTITGLVGPLMILGVALLLGNCALLLASTSLAYWLTLLNIAKIPLALVYLLNGFTREQVFRWLFNTFSTALSPIGSAVCFLAAFNLYRYCKDEFLIDIVTAGLQTLGNGGVPLLDIPGFATVLGQVLGWIAQIILQPFTFAFGAIIGGSVGILLQIQSLRFFSILLEESSESLQGLLSGLGAATVGGASVASNTLATQLRIINTAQRHREHEKQRYSEGLKTNTFTQGSTYKTTGGTPSNFGNAYGARYEFLINTLGLLDRLKSFRFPMAGVKSAEEESTNNQQPENNQPRLKSTILDKLEQLLAVRFLAGPKRLLHALKEEEAFTSWQKASQIIAASKVGEIIRAIRFDPKRLKLTEEQQMILEELLREEQFEGLIESRGFRKLAPIEQYRLLNLLFGNNLILSEEAKRVFIDWLNNRNANLDDPEYFRRFLDKQPYLQQVLTVLYTVEPQSREEYTVSPGEGISSFNFQRTSRAAQQYFVTFPVQDKTILITTPYGVDPQTINQVSVEQIAQSLAAYPELIGQVQEIVVQPERSIHDAFWAEEFGEPGFRAAASANSSQRKINIYPNSNSSIDLTILDAIMIHEIGHFISDNRWGRLSYDRWTPDDPRWNPWKDAMAGDGLSASKYARNNAAEDFSETLVLYIQLRDSPLENELRRLMPGRVAILEKLLKEVKSERVVDWLDDIPF